MAHVGDLSHAEIRRNRNINPDTARNRAGQGLSGDLNISDFVVGGTDPTAVDAIVDPSAIATRGGARDLGTLFQFFLGQAAQQAGLPAGVLALLGNFGRGSKDRREGGIDPGEGIVPTDFDEDRRRRKIPVTSDGEEGDRATGERRGGGGSTGGGGGGGGGGSDDVEIFEESPFLSLVRGTGPNPLTSGGRRGDPGGSDLLKLLGSILGGAGGFLAGGPGGVLPGAGVGGGIGSTVGGVVNPATPGQAGFFVGPGGNITPIFPDVNQQQLQEFLRILQELDQGGPSAALQGTGPNPLTTELSNPLVSRALLNPASTNQLQSTSSDVPPAGGGAVAGGQTVTSSVPGGGAIPGGQTLTTTAPDSGAVAGGRTLTTDVPIGGSGGQQDDLTGSLSPQGQQGNPFQDFAQFFSLPTFGGDFAAPLTANQRQATDAAGAFLGTDPFEQTQVAQDTLQDFLTTGGGSFANAPEFEALEARSRRRLDQERAQLNETFGTLGNRFGTEIARGQGELSARFLENEALQRAQIGRESFESQQARRLQGLGLSDQARQTGIAGSREQAQQIQDLFRIGEAERQVGDVGLQRQMAEFARTQGGLLPLLLQFLSSGALPLDVIPSVEE